MLQQLQNIGEHIQQMAGIPYTVFPIHEEIAGTCMIPSCSVCRHCPLDTKVYLRTHNQGIQDAERSGGMQIYNCPMRFVFCAFVPVGSAEERYALVLGPIVPGELHDGLYQSYSPELDRALTRAKHMTTLQLRSLIEITMLCMRTVLGEERMPVAPILNSMNEDAERVRAHYSAWNQKKDPFLLAAMEQIRTLIRQNNRKELEKYVTELVNRLYMENNNELNVYKARAIRLIDLFSALTIEEGQEAGEALNSAAQRVRQADHIASAEILCVWLKEIVLQMSLTALQRSRIAYRDVVSKTIQYLRANWNRKLSLDEVAESAYVSKAYLCTVFKREMGMSILEYLNRFRVEKAKELLRNSDASLVEIAEQCCFFDQSYFSKVFRRYVGETPRHWRETGRQRESTL